MSSERWQQVDRIFVDALQHAPDVRVAFVIEESGDDAALRSEVFSLLSASDASAEFMAASAFERLAGAVGTHGWTLGPGERVGPYTVRDLLGTGGAGEVWRAWDERLGRDVAIKVLLPHVSDDPTRLRRFADEARAVGSLNHPNIVAVYDVGDHHGIPFLVSECLDGASLRARLEPGPMHAKEVVAIGLGVARGLAAAHARSIVHRDLKPENVFIARDGAVKILDFGVAKLQMAGDRLGAGPDTITGSILGTAAYMAPEQGRGEDVDARTDLFALGVMLYEMLGGVSPFKRASVLETLHTILTVDPPDLVEMNQSIPGALSSVIMRLLRKQPEARFQSALDLAWTLEQMNVRGASVSRDQVPAVSRSFRRLLRSGLALAATAAVAAFLSVFLMREAPSSMPDAEATRFSWTLPPGVGLASAPAVSPDGRYVAFTGSDATRTRLLIRSLAAEDPVTIEGSDDARQPFWSPDSRWVGFFARGRVMKVSVAGGAPVAVDDERQAGTGRQRTERGGAWSSNGLILYGANFNPPSLFAVSSAGGVPVTATTLIGARAENAHRFPSFLPDGKQFLYQIRGSTAEGRGVFVGNVNDARTAGVRILDIGSNAVYAPTSTDRGVLLYVANGLIEAQRFNPSRRMLIGSAQPLAIAAGGETLFHPAALGVSFHVLAYSTQLASGRQIKAVGADGGAPTVLIDRKEQQWPRISPDGTRMAWLQIDPLEQNADIWVEDLARQTRTRVTTAPERDLGHVWSPDGRRLAYHPDGEDRRRLSIISADGSGASQNLVCPEAYCEPTDWSSDGRELIVNTYDPSGTDVWAVAVLPDGRSRPLLHTRFNERDARLSPDRRWIAYVSDEAGRPEVSVRSVAGSPRRYTVSPGGGDQVVWQRDGRGLYFVDPIGRLRKVSMRDADGVLLFGTPMELPVTIGSGHSNTQYDVAPDGRIYYLDPTTLPLPTEIRLVLGWQSLLK